MLSVLQYQVQGSGQVSGGAFRRAGGTSMETARQNPDRFSGPNRNDSGTPGKLTLFFSYAAGAGETDAMLRSARRARGRDVDVVIGCIRPYASLGITASLEDLERLNDKNEFDMDAALKRRPGLLLFIRKPTHSCIFSLTHLISKCS